MSEIYREIEEEIFPDGYKRRRIKERISQGGNNNCITVGELEEKNKDIKVLNSKTDKKKRSDTVLEY